MPASLTTPPLGSTIDALDTDSSNLALLARHPYSALFIVYDLVGDEFQSMADSIKKDGLICPISRYEGKVLDGWNRYQACILAGVTPVFEDLAPGLDAWEFVKAKNLLRRHMNKLDRFAVLAAKLKLDREEATLAGECSKLNTPSVRKIGKDIQVSTGTASKFKKILDAGDPELTAAVVHKSISLKVGADIAERPAPQVKGALAAAAMAKLARKASPKAIKQTPTPKAQPAVELDCQEATVVRLTEGIRNLGDAYEKELGTSAALRAKVVTLQAINAERDERIRELSRMLTEALEEIERMKAMTMPAAKNNSEQTAVEEPEPKRVIGELAANDEFAEGHVDTFKFIPEEGQFEVPPLASSPLAMHTQKLRRACPPCPKNPDQPDTRSKEYGLFNAADDILEVEGRLQRGEYVSNLDREAYVQGPAGRPRRRDHGGLQHPPGRSRIRGGGRGVC